MPQQATPRPEVRRQSLTLTEMLDRLNGPAESRQVTNGLLHGIIQARGGGTEYYATHLGRKVATLIKIGDVDRGDECAGKARDLLFGELAPDLQREHKSWTEALSPRYRPTDSYRQLIGPMHHGLEQALVQVVIFMAKSEWHHGGTRAAREAEPKFLDYVWRFVQGAPKDTVLRAMVLHKQYETILRYRLIKALPLLYAQEVEYRGTRPDYGQLEWKFWHSMPYDSADGSELAEMHVDPHSWNTEALHRDRLRIGAVAGELLHPIVTVSDELAKPNERGLTMAILLALQAEHMARPEAHNLRKEPAHS